MSKAKIANPQFYYRGNDIVKLWEQYLKTNLGNEGQDVKFFVSSEDTVNSMFNELAQVKEMAIVLNLDNTLYKNKDGSSVTLCGEINYTSEDIKEKIAQVLDQLKEYNNSHEENKITDHIIIFPYHAGPLHWNLGRIVLTMQDDSINDFKIAVYEPFGGKSSDEDKILKQIVDVGNKEAFKIDNIKQQNDASSCGAITAEDGKEFLKLNDDGDKLLEKIYRPGAKELRQKHIEEINLEVFSNAQLHNEAYEAKGDKVVDNKAEIIEFLKNIIKNNDYAWVQDVLNNILLQNQDDNVLRANLNLFKMFVVQLSISDTDNVDKCQAILNNSLEFQEGAVDLINALAKDVQKSVKSLALKKDSSVQNLSYKKPHLYIKIDDKDVFEYKDEAMEEEISGGSITPTTFKSRILDSGLNWYVDKYSYKNNEVMRFGINYKNIIINDKDSLILDEKVELYNPKKQKSKNSQSTVGIEQIAKSISHHFLEKELLEKSINYLLESNNDTNTVLVDIFARDNGGIKKDQENIDCPEIHTVVLYKNPIKLGQNKHEVLVIDPSNFSFSSHLSNLNGQIFHKNLFEIITLHKMLQIYKANDSNNIGSDFNQYRDCTDIAVKIAFGLNGKKDLVINLNEIREVDSIKFISNNDTINDSIPGDVQTKHFVEFPLRIQQKSNTKISEDVYKFSKTVKNNLLKIDQRESLQEKYINTLLGSDKCTEPVNTVITLRSICENSFSVIREECEENYKSVLGETIDVNLYN